MYTVRRRTSAKDAVSGCALNDYTHSPDKKSTQAFMNHETTSAPAKRGPNLFALLKPYKGLIALLMLFAVLSNGLNLFLPHIVSKGIDSYTIGGYAPQKIMMEFSAATVLIFFFAYLQSLVQTYASELVARDLRRDLATKISQQSYTFIEDTTPSKLLTNLTSDVDAIKLFVSLAVVTIVSSLFLIAGSSILLLTIDWRLALFVLLIIPGIGGTFYTILRKVRVLFKKAQEVIDWLNKVINESILGAALIRVLHSEKSEEDKFDAANTNAKKLGFQMLKMFAAMIPIITFIANMAMFAILTLGGHFVINGTMTLGEFAAFNSYVAILVFPILLLGFMSNIMARAGASFARIDEVLSLVEYSEKGTLDAELKGNIEFKNVTVNFGEKSALKDVTFSIKGGTKTAIIGPTAAGKTQLLYLLTGLTRPTTGAVIFDGVSVDDYETQSLHRQIGFVFQDSIVFSMTLRENIAFSEGISEEALKKAVETAELSDFVASLPKGMETMVSERGTSLSGGQKQRIMLARALALNPKILLLDDFTARVDRQTEQSILKNVAKNYPGITLVSITQKIPLPGQYEHVLLLMEGELLAAGTHETLLETSPEYAQIAESQHSTTHYEL